MVELTHEELNDIIKLYCETKFQKEVDFISFNSPLIYDLKISTVINFKPESIK